MEAIKSYFKEWDLSRVMRLVIGVGFAVGYFILKEEIYLLAAIFFAARALFNLSCPGGSCKTPASKDETKPVMKFEKFEPNKNKE